MHLISNSKLQLRFEDKDTNVSIAKAYPGEDAEDERKCVIPINKQSISTEIIAGKRF